MSAFTRYAALLRGVNVGGKNKLPMADLAAMFAKAGCREVKTYIQSGNVVFGAEPAVATKVPAAIAKAIQGRFGFAAPVVLRSASEMLAASTGNPFLKAGADPEKLHIGFLADPPAEGAVASLDANRSPPDAFVVVGKDVYLHLPNGVARTKLTNAYFDSRLGTTTTIRNWKTVLSLVAMTAGT